MCVGGVGFATLDSLKRAQDRPKRAQDGHTMARDGHLEPRWEASGPTSIGKRKVCLRFSGIMIFATLELLMSFLNPSWADLGPKWPQNCPPDGPKSAQDGRKNVETGGRRRYGSDCLILSLDHQFQFLKT